VFGSQTGIWGFGVVQSIDSAEMDVFVGFRHHQADVDLVDNAGAKVPSAAFNDFITVMSGATLAGSLVIAAPQIWSLTFVTNVTFFTGVMCEHDVCDSLLMVGRRYGPP
jgi:hypothetical protein